PDRATADVRLRDLAHVQSRLHARDGALPLESLLHRERVEDRREHAHVVAGRAVHPLRGRLEAAVEVAAADHERDLEPERMDVDELARERVHRRRVEPELARPHQRLSGKLEQDAREGYGAHRVVNGDSRHLADRVPLEVDELEAAPVERLRDRQARVVDPRLLLEHGLGEETLVEHALDDLLTDVLGLALDLVAVREDLALGGDELPRNLGARSVRGAAERDVQRQLACDAGLASPDLEEDADLPRRMDVGDERLASLAPQAARADDLDVLAEAAGELDPALLEDVERVLAAVVHLAQDVLGELAEVLVLRDGLGLAPDRDDRAVSVVLLDEHDAFGRLTSDTLG